MSVDNRKCSVIVAGILAMGTLGTERVEAGDRELEVLFVNMTPNAQSTKASNKCIRLIKKQVVADYAIINKLGETRARKRAGKMAGESMLTWSAKSLASVKGKPKVTPIDTLILVDCRPETQQFEAVVVPSSGGVARYRLQKIVINTRTAKWLAKAVLRRAWAGVSP